VDNEKQERTGAKKKKYLIRYINNLRKVARLERKLDSLKDRLTSIRSSGCSNMSRGCSSYTVEDLLEDISVFEVRIERLRINGENLKRETLDYIGTLDTPIHTEILKCQYIDDLSHMEIGKLLGHTTSTIGLYYRRAIAKLKDPIDPRDKDIVPYGDDLLRSEYPTRNGIELGKAEGSQTKE